MLSLGQIDSPEVWAEKITEGLHPRWRKRILNSFMLELTAIKTLPSGKGLLTPALFAAKHPVCTIMETMWRLRLTFNATDHEICRRAEEFALQAIDFARMLHQPEVLRAQMAHFVIACGLEPPDEKIKDRGAIARMSDHIWWRRGLRRMHANSVEGMSIELGYVNKASDIYVSDESVARRIEQNKRNAKALENTLMENEAHQQFTLAELAATSTSNKAIRRAELMTRIAGFEVIAKECGHAGTFLTITCPSRMHKWTDTGKNGVHINKKYDGTNPSEAQHYLSDVFARIRAKLARQKIRIYGFRIAEPHHDGCPHWHLLFFHKAGLRRRITRIFREHALKDSPNEAGAQKHRLKTIAIDWSKGSAAGYIAKYVAKNIDGLHIESDLYGNPSMETSLRVEAWATTWRIRQFQQIGGAPVGVWRELRRITDIPESAPQHLKGAHEAVNKSEEFGKTFDHAGEQKRVNWAGYLKWQGGVFIGRKAAIKLYKEQASELNKYGEDGYMRVIGVTTVGRETYRFGIVTGLHRDVIWEVESNRHRWTVVRGGVKAAGFGRPWTRVNNCTLDTSPENRNLPGLGGEKWMPSYFYG